MSKLKYMLGALGLSMALIMTGCGAAGGSQNTDSSVAAEESSTSAETVEKADDSQADASADQEEEKEPSHDLTGADAEGYIHDASYETRANAAAGSLEQPYGRYRLKDAEVFFIILTVRVPVITCRRERILFLMMPARTARMKI